MKSRVLDQLYAMSTGEGGDMQSLLLQELADEMDAKGLVARAKEAYELILHNYSRFEISTIDSFFSRVVRSFARELDIPMSYELEMNTALALDEAVDQLFRSLAEEKQLKLWLEQYTFDQIEEDKSWNVESNIRDLGNNLFKEQFQEGFMHVDISMERLTELVGEMKKVIRLYEDGMEALGRKATSLIENSGLDLTDFNYGKSGPANTFFKLQNGDFDLGARFLKAAAGELGWASKKSPQKELADQLADQQLMPIAEEVLVYVKKYEVNYRTAKALFRNIYAFGLLEALNKNLKEYRDEQNIMLISDNNVLIREIVGEDDAPFIFEKIGSFFKHILIDEFQDTSNFQWNNLKPLILNSMASGHEVLIVGDVKQSIYRFRGGNMRLLLEKVDQDLAHFAEVITTLNLEDNYRSVKGIVEFNNAFFEALPQELDRIEHVNDLSLVAQAYEGHSQNPRKGEGGQVEVALFKKDPDVAETWQEQSLERMLKNIGECVEQGYQFRDILVLVNRNGEMPGIAECLLKEDIPFVSERSLMLGNHDLIRFLIEVLQFLQSEEDDIGLVNLAYLYRKLSGKSAPDHFIKRIREVSDLYSLGLPEPFLDQRRALAQLPLFDLVERLLLIFDFRARSDVFVQRFQDLLLEQSQRGIHSIHGFLEWWQEQGHLETISGNENANAVRIMSVHKSKGLEAPIVIMPFADYSFLPNAQLHSFWTSQLPEYLEDLAFVPLKYSKNNLINTDFEEAFRQETLESVMDALNKTYVAFTRAREKLFITGPQKTPGRAGFQSISQFLESILEGLEMVDKNEINNVLIYEYKSILNSPPTHSELETPSLVDTYPNANYIDHLAIRPDSDRFFMLQGTENAENINLGRHVYEVLSLMGSAEEGGAVVKRLVAEGLIPVQDLELISDRVDRLMKHEQINAWFGPDYEVFTERELVHEGKVLKPDRVMVKEGQAVVVNYHKEKEQQLHEARMKQYMTALNGLGFEQTKGFLVYVEPVEIKEVLI